MGLLQTRNSLSSNFEEELLESNILPQVDTRARLVLSLNFDLIESATLESLRIDMLKFLPWLGAVLLRSGITVRVTLNCPGRDNQGYTESLDVAAEDLARRAFLLLSDLLDNPAIKDSAESQESPHIWMNGCGELLSASYQASSMSEAVCIGNRYSKLKAPEVIMKGYRLAAVPNQPSSYHVKGSQLFNSYAIWEKLRYKYWRD